MILLISDIHGFFQVINDQLSHARQHTGSEISQVVVLGDLGLFTDRLHKFFTRQQRTFLQPISFIDGNHEEFKNFQPLLQEYAAHLTHIPRGCAQKFAGHSCLCLGGSSFIDVLNTPEPALISDHDIDTCLQHPADGIDLVFTHDCPQGIGVPHSQGWDIHGPIGFQRSWEILSRYSPRYWIFGHHHRWFERTISDTRFVGLPLGWEGYALLAENGQLELIRHSVTPEQPILKRWFGGLLGG